MLPKGTRVSIDGIQFPTFTIVGHTEDGKPIVQSETVQWDYDNLRVLSAEYNDECPDFDIDSNMECSICMRANEPIAVMIQSKYPWRVQANERGTVDIRLTGLTSDDLKKAGLTDDEIAIIFPSRTL